MPIWKQRLFARLQNANDGEGNDLGGGGTASAIDQLGLGETEEQPTEVEQPGEEGAATEGGEPVRDPMAGMNAMLDKLTEGAPEAKKDEPEALKEEPKPDAPKTPEQEEAELLDGVKSERGKERIQKMLAERKQYEQDVTEFKQMVQSTGMSAQEFAQTLEFGRLASSNDPAKVQVAIEMIEQQRAQLYARIGKEAPGVDLLKDHPDLQQAVESMEVTRDKAVELAKHRRAESAQRQQMQAQQQAAQSNQQYQQAVATASQQAEAYLSTRAKEADHPHRMKAISDYFRDPANMQEFVGTFQPHQWAAAIKMKYDSIQAPRAPANQPRPISARPSSLGRAAPTGASGPDKLMGFLDNMNI